MKACPRLAVLTALLALAACSSTRQPPTAELASTPFNDLNLMRKEIPPILQQAKQQLYRMPADASCAALTAELLQLDQVLGPDVDALVGDDESGADMLGDAATGAIRSALEGVIPFRNWVRKISGAERNAREAAAAVVAGAARRAFLKGVSAAQGCVLSKQAAN